MQEKINNIFESMARDANLAETYEGNLVIDQTRRSFYKAVSTPICLDNLQSIDEQKGNSNIYLITAELHQFSVLGINTHDVGFDCDAATLNIMILNQTEVAKTASFTVEAPAGYMLHAVTLVRNTGSAGIELGITATGDEVFTATTIDGTDSLVTVQTHYAMSTATTLYFTVTGTVNFDVNLQYILNPLS